MTRKAVCCCGACELEVEGEPVLNALCHCDNCKRRTGSAFGWSVYFADDKIVSRSGETGLYRVETTGAERQFCKACGTTLSWSSTSFMPGYTGIAAGCFAADLPSAPNISATDAKRCAWMSLPEGWIASP